MNAELGNLPEEFWNALDDMGISAGYDSESESAFNTAIEIGLQIVEYGYLSDDWYDLYGDDLQSLVDWCIDHNVDPHDFFEAMYGMV